MYLEEEAAFLSVIYKNACGKQKTKYKTLEIT